MTNLTADYVDLGRESLYVIDLRYASTNNFLGRNLYGEFTRAYLHRDAALKLRNAAEILTARAAGHRLIIFDALRPRSVQQILWDAVLGTPNQAYLADPALGSLHSYGFAVDVSIVDARGAELDMGAGFDDFRPISEPRREAEFVHSGALSAAHVTNRRLLRGVMEDSGFTQLPHEWWHFDALPREAVRARYAPVD